MWKSTARADFDGGDNSVRGWRGLSSLRASRELLACNVIVFDAVILQCRACALRRDRRSASEPLRTRRCAPRQPRRAAPPTSRPPRHRGRVRVLSFSTVIVSRYATRPSSRRESTHPPSYAGPFRHRGTSRDGRRSPVSMISVSSLRSSSRDPFSRPARERQDLVGRRLVIVEFAWNSPRFWPQSFLESRSREST